MSSRPIASVVKHEVRLDMLVRLDGEPQTIAQVGERIGRDEKSVAQHMGLLEAFDLVGRTGDHDGEGRPFYVALLNDHPEWVQQAVDDRRRTSAK